MTEIPEHLLARSKARRSAIGVGEDAPADATTTTPAASTAIEQASSAAPAAAAGPAGVAARAPAKAPLAAPPVPPKPRRPEVVASENRKKIPWWAVPALAGLPLWAILYAFTLEPPTRVDPVLAQGSTIYHSVGCSGCHGSTGGGQAGVFPALTDGDIALTFPNYLDQIAWIQGGSGSARPDGSYGDPARAGGVHNIATLSGNMPAFPQLNADQLLAVARYERETLSGIACDDPNEQAAVDATAEVCP